MARFKVGYLSRYQIMLPVNLFLNKFLHMHALFCIMFSNTDKINTLKTHLKKKLDPQNHKRFWLLSTCLLQSFPREDDWGGYLSSSSASLNCEVCGKQFSRRFTLNRHMMIHTDEKPFQCSRCNYKTRYKQDLLKHIAMKHMWWGLVSQIYWKVL